MVSCWRVLGIAPTLEVIAIKRAYASKLKERRPEEDAQAYQALREALDEALERARHNELFDCQDDEPSYHQLTPLLQAAPASPPDNTATEREAEPAPKLMRQPVQEPDDSVEQQEATADSRELGTIAKTPKELADNWEIILDEEGPAAFLEQLPFMLLDLDRLPLSWRNWASVEFADFALNQPSLPNPCIVALAQYFGWDSDYRSALALGPQRAQAIHKLLASMGSRTGQPPAQRFRELLQFDALLRQGQTFRALLFATLAHPRLWRRVDQIDVETASVLGITELQSPGFRSGLYLAVAARSAVVLMIALLAAGLTNSPNLLLGAGGVALASGLITKLFDRITCRVESWHPASPHSGLAGFAHCAALAMTVMLGVFGMAAMKKQMLPTESLSLLLAAGALLPLLLAWPARQPWRGSIVPIAATLALAAYFAELVPSPYIALAPCFSVLAVLLSLWSLRRYAEPIGVFYRQPLSALWPTSGLVIGGLFLIRKVLILLIITICTLLLPMTLLVQGSNYGSRHVLATLLLAWSFGFYFQDGSLVPQQVFVSAAILSVLLPPIQNTLARLANRIAN